jgi:F0F1-type ATP synthase epsilon subunit
MKVFELEIITPERKVFKGNPYSLIVPAYEGYLGIMANHAPFLGILQPGKVTIRLPAPADLSADLPAEASAKAGALGAQEDQIYQITGGLIDVGQNRVTILADEVK